MNDENKTSASGSGETPTDRPQPDRPGEAEYLNREAAAARAAVERTLHEMASSIGQAADPRAWVERYPWWTIAAVATAGFFIGRQLTRPKHAGGRPVASDPVASDTSPPAEPVAAKQSQPVYAGLFAQLADQLGKVAGDALLGLVRQIILQAFGPAPRPPEPPQSEEPPRGN